MHTHTHTHTQIFLTTEIYTAYTQTGTETIDTLSLLLLHLDLWAPVARPIDVVIQFSSKKSKGQAAGKSHSATRTRLHFPNLPQRQVC